MPDLLSSILSFLFSSAWAFVLVSMVLLFFVSYKVLREHKEDPELIPTLLHFTIAASALTLWLPQHWRHRIATNLHSDYYKQIAATSYLTITPLIGLLAPVALLYGLYELLMAQGHWLANILLSWAKLLAGA